MEQREILFRGKCVFDGRWAEGNLFIPDKEDTPTQICIGTNVVRITYDIIPETVGQYTGLTDKNGKKIFEGDVVRRQLYGRFDVTYTVEYNVERKGHYPFACGDGCGCCENETVRPEETEIIGNIHDNPEFLEVQ